MAAADIVGIPKCWKGAASPYMMKYAITRNTVFKNNVKEYDPSSQLNYDLLKYIICILPSAYSSHAVNLLA